MACTSVGVDLVPLGLFLNAPGAFGYPDTTWGARIKFQPDKRFYTMIGAYNGDPALKDGTHHGLDFSMRGPIFRIGEAGFRWTDSKNIKFGAYYNDGARYGLYVLGDQVLSRWGDPEENRHLGAFGAFISAPDQRANTVPYFFDTGLVAYGPVRNRPKDFASFAVVYGSYSRDLHRPEEMTFEWNYAVSVRPGLLVQPGIQYLINPNGNKTTPNALAIGTNIVINW
jgi:porin